MTKQDTHEKRIAKLEAEMLCLQFKHHVYRTPARIGITGREAANPANAYLTVWQKCQRCGKTAATTFDMHGKSERARLLDYLLAMPSVVAPSE